MPTYEVKLTGHEDVAAGTTMFRIEKPAGFNFRPGQAVTVSLINPPAEPNSARRTFSLVSAPFEKELAVATRMRDSSAFKRVLKALPSGAVIKLQGPFGDMTLHEDRARPAAFIAGGIGITPFMSMVRQATKEARSQRLFLIYANRRPEDAAFLAELQDLESQNENLRLCATMTEMGQSARGWDGDRRMVDAEFIRRCVADIRSPVYYLAGPPAMVESMQEMLRGAGVAESDVLSEEFYGY